MIISADTTRRLIACIASLSAIVRAQAGSYNPAVPAALADADDQLSLLRALIGEPDPAQLALIAEVVDATPTPEGFEVIRRALDEATPITLAGFPAADMQGLPIAEVHPSAWPSFTVFIREASLQGTTYITSCQCPDIETAKAQALQECFADWGWDEDEDRAIEDLVVLGVGKGNFKILEWDDGE